MASLSDSLAELGLSAQESATYLAALELGFSSISDIAKKASIKRPTAYYIIEELIRKNLISRAPKGKRVFYLAERPQNLLHNIRRQEERLVNLMPELEALQKSAHNRPNIRFFEGKEGICAIYNEIFNTHNKMLAIGSLERIMTVITPEENTGFFNMLRNQGGKIRDLLDDSKEARAYIKSAYRKGLGPAKYLPKDFKFGTDMLIAGDKISLVSYSAMVGLLIDNAEIAQTQRQTFEFMWKHL
jgi:HTH-type transcriptional regulator, sugar sensing transcriptional regulator